MPTGTRPVPAAKGPAEVASVGDRLAERNRHRIDDSFLTSRRSFEAGILLNGKRSMKDVAFYDCTASQLDAISMDSSFHTSADGQFFRDDVAVNFCAIVDHND
jgi:hypothetical protein